jgi:hypothetical protein
MLKLGAFSYEETGDGGAVSSLVDFSGYGKTVPKRLNVPSPSKIFGLLDSDCPAGLNGVVAAISGAHLAAGGFGEVWQKNSHERKPTVTAERNELSMLELVDNVGNGMLAALARMRELAVQGTWSWLEESDKLFLEQEFGGLAEDLTTIPDRHDRAMGFIDIDEMWNGCRPSGADSSSLIRVNIGLWEFSPSQLGIPVERIGIGSMGASRNAISMIDTAIDRLESIRAEYDFLHEQVDSALSALRSHVGSEVSEAEFQYGPVRPDRIRLTAMQRGGVTGIDEDPSFQQSIRALVQ